MTQYVRDLMTSVPVTVGPHTSVAEVARVMRDRDLGSVLVTDGDRLRGVVTDRDLVVRALALGTDPEQTTVAGACSEDPVTVGPGDELERAVRLMREHAVRRIPVVEAGRLVGVISSGDAAIEREPDSVLAAISVARPRS
ncbi:CBS domain-containing protein [Streptomyces sp. bgisy022]|uniref:CBS domain-containing protein n=1 Tax=Streptomyces sp. bgisy022 TaxID=3413769 RepID=UPI003D722E89